MDIATAPDGKSAPPADAETLTLIVDDAAELFMTKCTHCRYMREEGLVVCANTQCGQCIYPECFEIIYIDGKGVDPLPNKNPVCMKKCYDMVMSLSMCKPGWNEDRAHRPKDPHSSEYILLDRLLAPENYNKFR